MQTTPNIKISEFDYHLPDEQIAKYPLSKRHLSKLLVYKDSQIQDFKFDAISEILPKNTRLIFNNTKVIQARLIFHKETGAKIEIFCLEPYQPAEYVQSFESKQSCQWTCMVGNSKKWKSGTLHQEINIENQKFVFKATRIESENPNLIEFSWDNPQYSFSEILEQLGELPIPPYLNRKTEESDLERYQTVYSKIKGSVAAPTAGLHFTPEVLDTLKQQGTELEEITLHVGAGTFKPVKSEDISHHEMHTEHFLVQKSSLKHLLDERKNIPVGTTSVRTLESLFWLAIKIKEQPNLTHLHVNQWEPYQQESSLSKNEALQILIDFLDAKKLDFIEASTNIMIVPGYKFRFSDAIVTNFHQPKSTLLLLISAFVGKQWKDIYQHALSKEYRFLSYGDSSLLIKNL